MASKWVWNPDVTTPQKVAIKGASDAETYYRLTGKQLPGGFAGKVALAQAKQGLAGEGSGYNKKAYEAQQHPALDTFKGSGHYEHFQDISGIAGSIFTAAVGGVVAVGGIATAFGGFAATGGAAAAPESTVAAGGGQTGSFLTSVGSYGKTALSGLKAATAAAGLAKTAKSLIKGNSLPSGPPAHPQVVNSTHSNALPQAPLSTTTLLLIAGGAALLLILATRK